MTALPTWQTGSRSGCAAIVRQLAPMVIYTYCAAHQLNLAVVSACKIQDCHDAESFIGKVAQFFKFSAKRQQMLDQAVELLCPADKAKKLKDAAEHSGFKEYFHTQSSWSFSRPLLWLYKPWSSQANFRICTVTGIGMERP